MENKALLEKRDPTLGCKTGNTSTEIADSSLTRTSGTFGARMDTNRSISEPTLHKSMKPRTLVKLLRIIKKARYIIDLKMEIRLVIEVNTDKFIKTMMSERQDKSDTENNSVINTSKSR